MKQESTGHTHHDDQNEQGYKRNPKQPNTVLLAAAIHIQTEKKISGHGVHNWRPCRKVQCQQKGSSVKSSWVDATWQWHGLKRPQGEKDQGIRW